MSKKEDEIHIHDRLRENPCLLPVFTSVMAIPERLKAYDHNLFLVLNTQKQHYEVHSLDNKGDTYCLTVPLNELDSRVLYLVRKHNIRVRGDAVLKEIKEHNDKLKSDGEKKREDDLRMTAREVQRHFKKIAYGYI